LTVSKLTKKERPTNLDLQEQVAEVHGCLENLGLRVDAQGQRLVTQGQQLVAIADAMGVRLPTEDELARGEPVKPIGRRVGGLSPWQAAGGAAAVITCAMAAYKVIEPALVAGLLALHHALMGH
jgi:hypothetical protein